MIDVITEKDWVLDAGGHADASGTPDVNPRRFKPLSFNGWDINDAKWSAVTTVGGKSCRNYAVVSGETSATRIRKALAHRSPQIVHGGGVHQSQAPKVHIAFVLRQAEARTLVAEVVRKSDISEQTF